MSKNFELLQRIGNLDQTVCFEPLQSATDVLEQALHDNGRVGEQHSEIYKLVRSVLSPASGAPPEIIAFVQVEADCTRDICAQAATALVDISDSSVVVVDCNLSEEQRITSETGVSDALARGLTLEKVAVSNTERLYTIPSGSAGGLRLLTAPRIIPQFKALRKKFDFIFVAAPPISKGAPALAVTAACDAVVLIIESNATRRDVTIKAKESLIRAGCNLVGVVLNGRTFPIPDNIYKRL